jgi:hypothetical protein
MFGVWAGDGLADAVGVAGALALVGGLGMCDATDAAVDGTALCT